MNDKAFRRLVVTREATLPGWPAPAAARTPSPTRGVTPSSSTRPRRSPSTPARPRAFKIQNHNKLLYNYPGTIGIKNGYTSKAKRTYVSAVSRGGRTYLLAEMYGVDVTWHDQAALYDWAFRHGTAARPVGILVEPGQVPMPLSTAQAASAAGAQATSGTAGPTASREPAPAAASSGPVPDLRLTAVPSGPAALAGGAALAVLTVAAGVAALRRERRLH